MVSPFEIVAVTLLLCTWTTKIASGSSYGRLDVYDAETCALLTASEVQNVSAEVFASWDASCLAQLNDSCSGLRVDLLGGALFFN